MNPALLLVDLQDDYLNTPGLQPAADAVIARAAALLAGCRQRRIPVFHIWTTVDHETDRRLPHWKKSGRWLCVAGTAGHQTPAALQPLEGETIIHKSGFNAFANPELDAALRRLKCDTLLLAGVHLHTCVRAVATESLERGLKVFIGDDAVASNDPLLAAATRRWLADRCVQFEPVNSLLERLDGVTAPKLLHRSPRETETILFQVPVASPEEVTAAAATAHHAGQDWRRTTLSSRCEMLERVAARLETAAPELARQMAIEIGKPLAHGLEEVRRAAGNIRDVLRRAAASGLQQRETAGLVRHEPLGVVALISPWNNPVAIPVGKLAPALAYGNTVVWKPAPAATRISQFVLQLFREAGAPHQAIQLLTGDHTTAQQLAADKHISAVTLTGSAHAGFAIQEICARRFVPLQAELSGNNAAIVWDDADLPHAAAQIVWGAFGFAGQRCTANRRVIVSAARFEELLREMKTAASRLVWGDPLENTTDIGPVIHTAKREEQTALIQTALTSGAAHRAEFPHEPRTREPWTQAGAYAQPAIVCCDQPEHPLVQEETMSPLLVVQRAEDFEHALALCNGVRHGLVAALFSRAPELQKQFLAAARAGMLKLNTATAGVDASLPFGGWKSSSLGPPEHGAGDLQFYTRMQAVYGAENLTL